MFLINYAQFCENVEFFMHYIHLVTIWILQLYMKIGKFCLTIFKIRQYMYMYSFSVKNLEVYLIVIQNVYESRGVFLERFNQLSIIFAIIQMYIISNEDFNAMSRC